MDSKVKKVKCENREIGARGEDIAASFLIQEGHNILVRNWRCKEGEIDVITRKGSSYHVIEVKARRSARAGYPEESMTDTKLQHLSDAADAYFADQQMNEMCFQIDVVCVDLSGEEPVCTYVADVG